MNSSLLHGANYIQGCCCPHCCFPACAYSLSMSSQTNGNVYFTSVGFSRSKDIWCARIDKIMLNENLWLLASSSWICQLFDSRVYELFLIILLKILQSVFPAFSPTVCHALPKLDNQLFRTPPGISCFCALLIALLFC